MPSANRSLLTVDTLHAEHIAEIFSLSERFRANFSEHGYFIPRENFNPYLTLALLFLEPSTRTRLSFEMACLRLGIRIIHMESPGGSSLEKGETFLDTVATVAAMNPSAIVIRSPNDVVLEEYLQNLSLPVISGGTGVTAHPTQALLDAFTVQHERGQVKGEKILLVGDTKHSRVAESDISLFTKLGAEVAIVSPPELRSQSLKKVRYFETLNEGIAWATVCMALRIQKERLTEGVNRIDLSTYVRHYQINSESLKGFCRDGVIMHPGPANRGIEISDQVFMHPRCRIAQQVSNGVYVRAALLAHILGVKVD